MLEALLSKLGASTKITVGVSISPGIGLEMIEIDRITNTVNKYASKPLEYNQSTREIVDYNQFQSSLEELFDELHIPRKSNIILNIPNVQFGMINLPLLLPDEAITNAIISEVEQSYIFKRQEPVVSWAEVYSNIDTENRTLAYTAIQKSVLGSITEICTDVGCTLVGMENSYISLLRALHYTGLAKEQMKENVTWNLMIIGQNSYSILSMAEKKIIEYYEEPLALKSFIDDEIYNAITTSAKLTLAGLPAGYLYIVSETDLVSAEVLSLKLSTESTVKFLECNKYAQNELLPCNLNILPKLAAQITLEAIGAAAYPFCDFPTKLNLIQDSEASTGGLFDESAGCPKVNVGNLEIELTPDFIKKISLILGGIIIAPLIILAIALSTAIIPNEQAKLDSLQARIKETSDAIAKYNKTAGEGTFDVNEAMNKIESQNKSKLSYYTALGVSMPNNLWVTYYATNETGKIDIKGKSTEVESVYAFYKSIKQLVNNSDVRLYKLEVASESIDDVISSVSSGPKYYDFEVTNMSEAELNPPVPAAGTDNQQAQPAPAATDQKPGFQLGKPLFGPKTDATQTPAIPGPTNQTKQSGDFLPKNLSKIENF